MIAVCLAVFGMLFCWLAVAGWRHRREERISLLEAGILKTTGQAPLRLTQFDHILQIFQLVMMSIFGPSMVLIGGYGILSEIGVL